MLRAEDVAMEVGNPLPASSGHIQVPDRFGQMGGHAAPVEVRIAFDEISRGLVP